jgi:hypothetical protein
MPAASRGSATTASAPLLQRHYFSATTSAPLLQRHYFSATTSGRRAPLSAVLYI